MKRGGFARKVYTPAPAAAPRPLTRAVQYAQVDDKVLAQPKMDDPRNPHLLTMARGQPCLLRSPICCNDPETTVACHGAGVANGKGMGFKAPDFLSVHGCYMCNHFTDAYNGATAEEKAAVFEAGHARQVELWQSIAASTTAPPRDRDAAQWALDQFMAFQLARS